LSNKVIFFSYILGLGIVLSSHSFYFLSIFGLFLLFLSQQKLVSIVKSCIKSFLVFNVTISIGFIVMALLKNQPWFDFVLLFNFRVFDLTFMTILFSKSVNVASVLSFSSTLSFLFTMALSQIISYQRSYENFLLSLKSRMAKKMSERHKKEFITSVFGYFFKKALYDSEEKSLALKARGFFDKA